MFVPVRNRNRPRPSTNLLNKDEGVKASGKLTRFEARVYYLEVFSAAFTAANIDQEVHTWQNTM